MEYLELLKTPNRGFYGKGVLSVAQCLEMCIAISAHHDKLLQVGTPNNGIWVLAQWEVQPKKDILPGSEVRVQTELFQDGRLGIVRSYRIDDAFTNEPLFCACAKWVLMDAKSRRLLRIGPETLGLDHIPPSDHGFTRLVQKEEEGICTTLPLVRLAIDENEHVNNLAYLAYAIEVLTEEEFTHRKLIGLSIRYHKELRRDHHQHLDMRRISSPSETQIEILNPEGEHLVTVQFRWAFLEP